MSRRNTLLAIILLSVAFLFACVSIIFFSEAVKASNEESLYFKSSILVAVVSSVTALLNIVLIVFLAVSSGRLQSAALSVAEEFRDTSRRIEFSTIYPLFTQDLDGILDDLHRMLLSDLADAGPNTGDQIYQNLKKLTTEERIVYLRPITIYKEKYDAFSRLFSDYKVISEFLKSSKYGVFRRYLNDFL